MSNNIAHIYKLTSQLDPKVPSEYTIELYDLSPQRMVGLPVRDSRVICVQNCKAIIRHTIFLNQSVTVSHALCGPYIRVVLWSGVGFRFIQRYDEQAALNGLQDGFIVWINVY